MKYGNVWTSTIGAGVVIAGMMTAGHATLQSPAFLFLAGQIKVAIGNTDEGIRLMNAAATQRNDETNKVHAAEMSAAADNEGCTEKTTGNTLSPRPAATNPVKVDAAKHAKPLAIMAKLDMPDSPFVPEASVPGRKWIDPVAFHYLTESQRVQVIQAQANFEKIQVEKAREIRRAAHAMRNVPAAPGFVPADIFNLPQQPGVPVQMAQ